MELHHTGFKKWKPECLVTELAAREEEEEKKKTNCCLFLQVTEKLVLLCIIKLAIKMLFLTENSGEHPDSKYILLLVPDLC